MRIYFAHPIVLPYALYYIVIVLGEPLGEPSLPVRRYPLTSSSRAHYARGDTNDYRSVGNTTFLGS
jgi:hypothetical protein